MYESLPKSFYEFDTRIVAEKMLGKLLVRQIDEDILVGKIVETEAYLGELDPAAHASFGKTARTKVLYGEPGHAYVFSLHGRHCLNAVAEPVGKPGCVLIRALEPLEDIAYMRQLRNRGEIPDIELTNGPGKLCQALQIDMTLYGIDFTHPDSPLRICYNQTDTPFESAVSRRIGITKASDWDLRFYIKGNPFVSLLPRIK